MRTSCVQVTVGPSGFGAGPGNAHYHLHTAGAHCHATPLTALVSRVLIAAQLLMPHTTTTVTVDSQDADVAQHRAMLLHVCEPPQKPYEANAYA